jgi:hypothetical protein
MFVIKLPFAFDRDPPWVCFPVPTVAVNNIVSCDRFLEWGTSVVPFQHSIRLSDFWSDSNSVAPIPYKIVDNYILKTLDIVFSE